MDASVGGWTNYAEIPVNYSSLGDVTLLHSYITMLGDDGTHGSSTLCRGVALASMTSSGGIIQKVGVHSNSYKTIRIIIRVAYRKNY